LVHMFDFLDQAVQEMPEFIKLHKTRKKRKLNDEEMDRYCDLHAEILNRLLSAWWIDETGPGIADLIVRRI